MLEIASVIVLGIVAQWVAWRIKVPSILPLILIGLIVGPLSTLYTADGLKFLEPIWTNGHGLFPGQNLFYFVELAIGLILFEGGLSLKKDEIADVGPAILKLSFLVGPLVTFFGAGIITHFLFDFSWEISFLFSALIIVTGPTVISPILRNLRLKPNVSAVLKWEGILIDPVGALSAVLVFEFIMTSFGDHHGGHGGDGGFTSEAVKQFLQIVLIGLSFGFLAGLGLRELLKRHWVPHYLLTVFTLAYVIATFVGSSILVHDSGLLTVVVLGMVIGNIEMPYKEEITYFGESITVLLISVLFILLSANITLDDLRLLLDWRCAALFASIIFIIRPLGVFLSTSGSNLDTNEKMFISWVGPRGIVAAGIASLFGLRLVNQGMPGAEYITPLVFMVVLGTVLLNATTAGIMAKMLGVLLDKSNGILILGAHRASEIVAHYLKSIDKHVVLIDSNISNIQRCEEVGLKAIKADIYHDEFMEITELNDMGYFMGLTGSVAVNDFGIEKFKHTLGKNGSYRLISMNEQRGSDKIPDNGLFSKTDDFINFSEVARDYPEVREIALESNDQLHDLLSFAHEQEKIIPLFIKKADGEIQIITAVNNVFEIVEGDVLVTLGKELEVSKV